MNHHVYLLISSDWLKVRPRRQHQHQSSLQCACVFHNVLWWLIVCMHIAYCTLGLVCKPISLYILYVLKTTKLTKIQPNFCPPTQDNIYQHNQIKSGNIRLYLPIGLERQRKVNDQHLDQGELSLYCYSCRTLYFIYLFTYNLSYFNVSYIIFIYLYIYLFNLC